MLTSLAFVFLLGLAAGALCQRLGLPRILGMLFTGIVLGPCALNLLGSSLLSIVLGVALGAIGIDRSYRRLLRHEEQ